MLTTIREKTQGIIASFILMLIVIPFALWGINSYFDNGSKISVAKVGGEEISQQAFRRALDQNRGSLDQAQRDDPQFKRLVLDNLIEQSLLVQDVEHQKLRMSDAKLAQLIRELPYFARDGKFDSQQYELLLRREGMTPREFEARVRGENLLNQFRAGLSDSGIVSQVEVSRVVRLMLQQREISFAVIDADRFKTKALVSAADIQQYYDSHADLFQVPETVRLQYIRLSTADLDKNYQPSESELQRVYTEEAARYVIPEKRRASHILVSLPLSANDNDTQQALAKIHDIEQQAHTGTDFANLAKKYSADVSTSSKGGDLGEIRRGVFSKELEKAIYQLKLGEVSKPVRTEFGYHLVKLTALTPEKRKPFVDVRKELIELARQHHGEERFLDTSEKFNDLIYEQPDSLEPTAKVLKLDILKSDWFSQAGGSGIAANPKVVAAAFSSEVLGQGRNSEAIEINPDTLVAVRVAEHRPASRKPLAEVRLQIEGILKQQLAQEAAHKLGEQWLRDLHAGQRLEDLAKRQSLKLQTPKPLTREKMAGVDRRIVNAVFIAARPQAGKPVYDMVDLGDQGYAVFALKVVKDVEGDKLDAETVARARQLLNARHGDDYYAAYRAGLRQDAKIKIYNDKL